MGLKSLMKKFALDIFDLLRRINDPNSKDIYLTLSEEQQKAISPLVVMRWLSGTKDQRQIIALNTFANKFIFPLAKHPHLQMQLLQACSSKTNGRGSWLGIKGGVKTNLRNEVLADYFDYSINEIRALTVFPSDEEIVMMAEELGWQKDEIAKLKKEQKDA